MKNWEKALRVAVLVTLFSTAANAQAPDAGHKPGDWPHAFPLWGEKLAQRGIKFMLPWGVGVNYAYVDQPINISRVAIGVNDSEMVDISELITFDKVRSQLHAMNARVDLWVLPFLNVYALGNAVIDAKTEVSISEPFSLQSGATQGGGGGGFGTTIAGGAWGFFGTIDMNWTWNKLEKLNAPVGTFLFTPRVGKNFGKILGVETIVWVGAMMQTIQAETAGQIRLSDALGGNSGDFEDELLDWYNGLPPARQALVRGLMGRLDGAGDAVIRYDLDKHIAQPWNMLIGTELGLTDSWRIRAEVGFIERFQVIVGLNYRFGDFLKKPDPQPTRAPAPASRGPETVTLSTSPPPAPETPQAAAPPQPAAPPPPMAAPPEEARPVSAEPSIEGGAP